MSAPPPPPPPDLPTLARVWGRIGLLSFGGPAAQIALMHREIVETRGWMTERQYLSALSFCMLLPGPEAMQLAAFSGWRSRGVAGGLIAGLLFILPGAAVVLALSALYAVHGQAPLVAALFLGVKAAVLAIVVEALARVARRALTRPAWWAIAAGAFAGLFLFALPFPLIVLAAGLAGLTMGGEAAPPAPAPAAPARGPALTVALWSAIWAAPVALVWAAGGAAVLLEVARFFSTLAVVSFGGAYAVLAYMAQEAVAGQGWLSPGEMIDGLGLAETTPGPLILVTEFVGFLAGYREGGLGLGLAAAAMTLWVTFAPCFLWIFAGAPYLDRISAQPRLAGALSAITAAVVGVILNLSLWFAINVLFAETAPLAWGPVAASLPVPASLEPRAAALAALAAGLLFGLRWGVARTLLVLAAAGTALGQL